MKNTIYVSTYVKISELLNANFFHSAGAPDAFAMGYQPIGGPDGSLMALAKLPGRSIYIHINNTNPILDAASPETALVRKQGIEIAFDGMELEL